MNQLYMVMMITDVIKMNFNTEDIKMPSFQPLCYGFKSIEDAREWIDLNTGDGKEMIILPYYK